MSDTTLNKHNSLEIKVQALELDHDVALICIKIQK